MCLLGAWAPLWWYWGERPGGKSMGRLGYITRRGWVSAHGILQLVLKRGKAVRTGQVSSWIISGFLCDNMTFPCCVCPVTRLLPQLTCWQHCVLELLELWAQSTLFLPTVACFSYCITVLKKQTSTAGPQRSQMILIAMTMVTYLLDLFGKVLIGLL